MFARYEPKRRAEHTSVDHSPDDAAIEHLLKPRWNTCSSGP
jgi:hypothetical protein